MYSKLHHNFTKLIHSPSKRRFLSQNILERDKNRVFDFSRQNESVSLKLEGMAEKTNDDANNLEAEYEVSSDWSLSWPGSDWLIS